MSNQETADVLQHSMARFGAEFRKTVTPGTGKYCGFYCLTDVAFTALALRVPLAGDSFADTDVFLAGSIIPLEITGYTLDTGSKALFFKGAW